MRRSAIIPVCSHAPRRLTLERLTLELCTLRRAIQDRNAKLEGRVRALLKFEELNNQLSLELETLRRKLEEVSRN